MDFKSKLNQILTEADLSRRDLLKRGAGAALSAAAPQGVIGQVTKAVMGGLPAPVQPRTVRQFVFRNWTDTYMEPDLEQSFKKVAKTFGLAQQLSQGEAVQSVVDEDYGFAGVTNGEIIKQLLARHPEWQLIQEDGMHYYVLDQHDNNIFSFAEAGSPAVDDWLIHSASSSPSDGIRSVVQDPIKDWWNQYGQHGGPEFYNISKKAYDQIKRRGLKAENPNFQQELDNIGKVYTNDTRYIPDEHQDFIMKRFMKVENFSQRLARVLNEHMGLPTIANGVTRTDKDNRVLLDQPSDDRIIPSSESLQWADLLNSTIEKNLVDPQSGKLVLDEIRVV
jgi:hypothetical protein